MPPLEEPGPPDDIVVIVEDPMAKLTGGALALRQGQRAWIVVDPDLTPAQRRAAIIHERIHLERGLPPESRHLPSQWSAVVAREERIVNAETARRIVPVTELAARVAAWCAAGDPVTPTLVAESFDTTPVVAARALQELARTRRGNRPTEDWRETTP